MEYRTASVPPAMRAFDRNNDGVIDRAEFATGPESPRKIDTKLRS